MDCSEKVNVLTGRLLAQQKLLQKSTNENEAIVKVSYHVAEILAKAGKPFSDGEVVEACILKAVEEISPEKNVAIQCN